MKEYQKRCPKCNIRIIHKRTAICKTCKSTNYGIKCERAGELFYEHGYRIMDIAREFDVHMTDANNMIKSYRAMHHLGEFADNGRMLRRISKELPCMLNLSDLSGGACSGQGCYHAKQGNCAAFAKFKHQHPDFDPDIHRQHVKSYLGK